MKLYLNPKNPIFYKFKYSRKYLHRFLFSLSFVLYGERGFDGVRSLDDFVKVYFRFRVRSSFSIRGPVLLTRGGVLLTRGGDRVCILTETWKIRK